jgi:hypothetical protein
VINAGLIYLKAYVSPLTRAVCVLAGLLIYVVDEQFFNLKNNGQVEA